MYHKSLYYVHLVVAVIVAQFWSVRLVGKESRRALSRARLSFEAEQLYVKRVR